MATLLPYFQESYCCYQHESESSHTDNSSRLPNRECSVPAYICNMFIACV